MDAFLAIEQVLHFHHLTSRQPIRQAVLKFRTFQNGRAVTQAEIDEILQVWPQAYRTYNLRGQPMIEALDLPLHAELRKATYHQRWSEKENNLTSGAKLLEENIIPDKKDSSRDSPELNAPRESILKGRTRCLVGNDKATKLRAINLLDRIRAKEVRIRAEQNPHILRATRDRFLQSQVPKLHRVLSDLTINQRSRSLDMENAMEIMRTNLFRLSDEELQRTLHMLAQSQPDFCSIVKVGDAERLKLRNSSTVSDTEALNDMQSDSRVKAY